MEFRRMLGSQQMLFKCCKINQSILVSMLGQNHDETNNGPDSVIYLQFQHLLLKNNNKSLYFYCLIHPPKCLGHAYYFDVLQREQAQRLPCSVLHSSTLGDGAKPQIHVHSTPKPNPFSSGDNFLSWGMLGLESAHYLL